MNKAIISNWNHVVGHDDVVYHLGDVALGAVETWNACLSNLNGYKILVNGNHDRTAPFEKQAKRDRFYPVYSQWFDEIHDDASIVLANGEHVNLSHYPYDGDSHGAERYKDYRLPDEGRVLIHGHTHSSDVISFSNKGTIQIHVGVDAHNYTPVSEQQVIDYIRVAGDLRV